MIIDIVVLLAGLALLIVGANLLVSGASDVARSMRISELLIGLTIVAFGTSSPELAVNLTAAWRGSVDLAFGNIVGSNICNIGLILGFCALLRPLEVNRSVIVREIPLMFLVSLVAAALLLDGLLSGAVSSQLSQGDGVVLLCLFALFLYVMLGDALAARRRSAGQAAPPATRRPLPWSVVFILVGFGGLLLGGRLTVNAASAIAEALAAPPVVIGLLVVGVGTSLPELATSAVAAVRGQTDLAIGNVVGSNIFNLLFILGLGATWKPIALPRGGGVDILVMLIFAAVLLPLAITHTRRLVRWEGALLLAAYVGYAVWRAV